VATLRRVALMVLLWNVGSPGRSGLYYSGETYAELPSQWRGFLLDHRALRNIAVRPAAGQKPNALRSKYEQAVAALEKTSGQRQLSAEEFADLGALYIRLGDSGKAVGLLRQGLARYPANFHIVANLGTAWQMQGDLAQAAANLRDAVALAPGKMQKAEELQLRLVQFRRRPGANDQELDDLFGIRFVGADGQFAPGQLAAPELKKLTADAAALTQQLALWLPADGRLLWQLAQLANAGGDVKTAAAMLDGCVTEFGLHHPSLRHERQVLRAAADTWTHKEHLSGLKARSRRPLASELVQVDLPPIDSAGVNALPWSLLGETKVDRHFHPAFPKYLQELEDKQVSLGGYIQPLGDASELTAFLLIEYPVGCWYCEMPEITGIVRVELAEGETCAYTRGMVHVRGQLSLNRNNPENFLYTIRQAKVKLAD
jgi:hypothetical protein